MKFPIAIFLLVSLFLICCINEKKNQQENTAPSFVEKQPFSNDSVSQPVVSKTQTASSIMPSTPIDSVIVEEHLIDSMNIGKKGRFKIDIKQTRKFGEGVYIGFTLYEKQGNKGGWKLKQSYSAPKKDGITGLNTILEDYNNDGYKDLSFQNGAAARMSNEIRDLFIFDSNSKKFAYIKNSSAYPNLRYNSELNCIDAWLVYGGSTTLFLKIEEDSLRPFAGVDLSAVRHVYTIDRKGQKKILSEEPIGDGDLDVYVRYKNYKPLKAYKHPYE